MLNPIFVLLIVAAVLTAAFTGGMDKVNAAFGSSAKGAVELAIGLIGQMAAWLGLMAVLREAGALRAVARLLAPLLRWLFPDVPPDHPAMSSIIMNLGANVLGLNNAATPFGLQAMVELNRLNPKKGVATNAMALFLAINVSGIAVIPVTTMAARAAMGSKDPSGIIVPSVLSSLVNTIFAVLFAKALQRLGVFSVERAAASLPPGAEADEAPSPLEETPPEQGEVAPASGWRVALLPLAFVALVAALVLHVWRQPPEVPAWTVTRAIFSDWIVPAIVVAILLFGYARRVRVYDVFVKTAKEGFPVAVSLIPYLVAILIAIGMLRASGALDAIVRALTPFSSAVGFPAEALPMALIRPFSGGGTVAVLSATMQEHGPDSFVGYFTSVLSGTSETTFYILAVYYGSVRIKAIRHTLWVCLAADLVGVIASLIVCRLYFT